MVRNRLDIFHAGFLISLLVGAGLVVWEFDVFRAASLQSTDLKSLELKEAMVLAGIFAGGLILFFGFFLRHRRELRQRVAAERETRRLALEDPLTGLPNRRQLEEALTVAVGAPPRSGGAHALLMLDLNGFKRVNDLHGHPTGDEVLIGVGNRLKAAIRDFDLVARLGGDEFAVLATHISGPEAAAGLALRITEELREPIEAHGGRFKIGTSIGIALIPQDGREKAEILRKADVALYRAKAQGGSAPSFFEESMDRAIRERDELEQELHQAVAAGQIVPFYQPLIDLKSGDIVGFEALARWPGRAVSMEPARFIPIAEGCGLIGDLTERILRQACVDAAGWPVPAYVAVNVSPVLLRDPTFGLRVLKILGDSGLAPSRLELEITESALVQDLESARSMLGALRESGIKIALDDFGTGYSSLYHLRSFQLDTIKIDRSFISSMATDRDSAAIVRALIGLAQGLNIAVTAEGVDTLEQQSLLAADGCTHAQGYLFSQAVPPDEARALLRGEARKRA